MNRRQCLLAAGSALALALPLTAREMPAAAGSSRLIYLTPIRSDGRESRCQAEIWFVEDAQDLYVVTAQEAWRAEAVRRGLTGTRIWVGDVGTWSRSGKHRTLPTFDASASLVGDHRAHERILALFGKKYHSEWSTWGPRFKEGLEEGSRVMLRYQMA